MSTDGKEATTPAEEVEAEGKADAAPAASDDAPASGGADEGKGAEGGADSGTGAGAGAGDGDGEVAVKYPRSERRMSGIGVTFSGPRRKVAPIKMLGERRLSATFAGLAGLAAKVKHIAHKPSDHALVRHAIDERSEFSHPDPINVCIAIDGSTYAHDAFVDACELMERGSHITVVHCSAPRMEHTLPPQRKAKAIHTKYKHELTAKFGEDFYHIEQLTVDSLDDSHDAVCDYVNKHHFQLLFVGLVGKRSPTDEPHVLGSATDYSVRNALVSTVVVKNHKHPDRKVWVVGVDGSLHAHNSLLVARRLAHSGDRIIAVHVQRDTSSSETAANMQAKIIEEYKREIENQYYVHDVREHKGTLEWAEIDPPRAKTIADALCDFAEEQAASYLVVGCDGIKATMSGYGVRGTMGSVSDRVVSKARCNVIVTETHVDIDIADGTFSKREIIKKERGEFAAPRAY